MAKSFTRIEYTEPLLIPTSSVSSCVGTQQFCMTKICTRSVTSSFWLVEGLLECGLLSTGLAIFEPVVPLLNLCAAHGIVVKCLLNLPIDFHLCITKLMAEFDTKLLLKSFHHFMAMKSQRTFTILTHSQTICW